MIMYDDKLKTNGELNYNAKDKKENHTTNAVTEFVDDDAPGTLTLS